MCLYIGISWARISVVNVIVAHPSFRKFLNHITPSTRLALKLAPIRREICDMLPFMTSK